MSKEDIINYVMTTPGNSNRAVLEGMLDSVGEGGSSGYSVDTKRVEICNNLFTTELDPIGNGYPAYIEVTAPQNDPNVIYVMFDGLNYVCNAKKGPIDNYYGADGEYDAETDSPLYNFTEYPFVMGFYRENNYSAINFICKDPGNHTVNISMDEIEVKVTAGFVNASMLAVTGKASSEPMYKVEEWSTWYDDIIPNLWKKDDWHVFTTSDFDNELHDILLAELNGDAEPCLWRGTFDGNDIEQAYWVPDRDVNLWKVYRLTIDENIQLQHRWKNEDPTEHYTTLVDNTTTEIDLSTFGEHHLKLEAKKDNITTSEDFNKAIKSVTSSDPPFVTVKVQVDSNNNVTKASHTFGQIQKAYNNGSMVTLYDQSNYVHTASVETSMYSNSFVGIAFSSNGKIYAMKYDNNISGGHISGTWTVTKTQLQTV